MQNPRSKARKTQPTAQDVLTAKSPPAKEAPKSQVGDLINEQQAITGKHLLETALPETPRLSEGALADIKQNALERIARVTNELINHVADAQMIVKAYKLEDTTPPAVIEIARKNFENASIELRFLRTCLERDVPHAFNYIEKEFEQKGA